MVYRPRYLDEKRKGNPVIIRTELKKDGILYVYLSNRNHLAISHEGIDCYNSKGEFLGGYDIQGHLKRS